MNKPIYYRGHPLPRAVIYIVRRACRYGTVRRMEVANHFLATHSTYVRWLNLAVEVAVCLRRRGRGRGAHLAYLGGEIPRWASFDSLLKEIECGNDPVLTGLDEEELPVSIPRWTRNRPVDPSAVEHIVRAITGRRAMRLRYVGLRRNEDARWRLVWPVGLERMGDQWRLIGLDLEKMKAGVPPPLRAFVLARILGAEPSKASLPRGVIEPAIHDARIRVPATLNPALTPDQRVALANELRIQDGVVPLDARSIFEFYRRFGRQNLSNSVVWPPLTNAAPKNKD